MNDPAIGETTEKLGDNVQDTHRVHQNPRTWLESRWREHRNKSRHPDDTEPEEDPGLYQPTLWWFTSTAFPLFAGTFGPIANLFSVCALVQTWRIGIYDGSRIEDPSWIIGMNSSSLALALLANFVLLFNFAHRIPYRIAQPITIIFWYLSSIFLLIPICFERLPRDNLLTPQAHSQSYYYALISCILYATVSSLLLFSTLGATFFHAYKPSFSSLTRPQRTLMLQTISFTLYLSIGAGVFARIEGWGFADGVYWADYTLLTVGLGSDFPLTKTLSRMLLIPYAAFGITLLGLVVSSVRGLVLERAKAKVMRRHLGKERERWKQNIQERRRLQAVREMEAPTQDSQTPLGATAHRWVEKGKEKRLMRLPHQFAKSIPDVDIRKPEHHGAWHRLEFELMRYIEQNAEHRERYVALSMSFFVIMIVWSGGALVFWSCEHKSQGWTFPDSFYFTYTTLLTIGYGDFYPNSAAGKPFFVVWSLISVPAMTVLISNMADTVVKWVQDFTVWLSRWTILPERKSDAELKGKGKKRAKRRTHSHHRKPSQSSANTNAGAGAGGTGQHRPEPLANVTVDGGGRTSEKASPNGNGDEGIPLPSTLERDIEYIGERVEEFEEDEGRPSSLAARVAREISVLAKDLRATPPRKYSWEEWSRWLEMLGEREREKVMREWNGNGRWNGNGNGNGNGDKKGQDEDEDAYRRMVETQEHGNGGEVPAGVIIDSESISPANKQLKIDIPQMPPAQDNPSSPSPSAAVGQTQNGGENENENVNDAISQNPAAAASDESVDWHWTWLGDQGPLFSKLTETEWLIEKLCFRLEEVLEDEIRQLRADADANARRRLMRTNTNNHGGGESEAVVED